MGVCGCVIPSPDCHCHFTPVSDWQYNNSINHLVTMPKSVLDQIGEEHTKEIERLRQQNAELQSIAYIIDGHGIVHHSFIIVYNDPAIAKATGGE